MANKYEIMDSEQEIGRVLILKDSWSDSYINIIKRENIAILRLSHSMGFKNTDLSFLNGLKNLKGVEIYHWDIEDITVLENLPDLELISIQCSLKNNIDFSLFSNLKILKITWNNKMLNLDKCHNLEYLNIDKYPCEDLLFFKQLVNLKRLYLTGKKLLSLSGIEYFPLLEYLDLYACTKLLTLNNIEKCQSLENVEIEACNKIENIKPIGQLKNLKIFHFVIKEIDSLSPIENCTALEKLIFYDTKVLDGDLRFIKKLPNLKDAAFQKRRHYIY